MTLSPERNGRITGSRVAGILGLSPYAKRDDVLRDMVRQHFGKPQEFTGNVATRHGQQHEQDAIDAYAQEHGRFVYGAQEFVIHPQHDFLGVSPDGLVDLDGMIEVKCPYRAGYTHHSERPDYQAQMQLQMACLGRKWCDFVVWVDGVIHVSRLDYDPAWLPSVMPKLEAFIKTFHDTITSEELSAPYIADKERDDAEWRNAVEAYRDANAVLESAKQVAEQAKQALIDLAPSGAKGCGVTVSKVERAGSIAYAKAIKDNLPDLDLSKYTGKPTTYYTVKDIAQ